MSPTKKHFFSASILFLIFMFATITVTRAATPHRPPLSEREQIKSTIEAYFESRYKGQQLLEAQDFSFLVADDSDAKQWAQQ